MTTIIKNNILLNTIIQKYEYEDEKLKIKNSFFNNIKDKTEIFKYLKNQLSEYKLELLQGGNFITEYNFNNNQLIKSQTKHFLNNNIVEFWNEKTYYFENSKLLRDEELTYSNVKDSTKIINDYFYNDDYSLEKINSKFENDFREIYFKYENCDIKKIEVSTNSNSALLKFTIPYGIEKKDLPVLYEEEFYYDKMNNLINKKMFLNKDLIIELDFKIEYYN